MSAPQGNFRRSLCTTEKLERSGFSQGNQLQGKRVTRAVRKGTLLLFTANFVLVSQIAAAADIAQGKALYDKHCAVCHGPQGRGDGPEAPFLSPRPSSLISAGTSAKTDAELLAVIANGKPRTSMRGWKDVLTKDQQQDILAYIRSLVRFQPPPLTPAPPGEDVR